MTVQRSAAPPSLEFMAIVNDARQATLLVEAGVDKVLVDLETYQKAERQRGRDTVQSDHSIEDIGRIRSASPTIDLVARCEPVLMPGWTEHVEAVVAQQPSSVMLPMTRSGADARRFIEQLAGRTQAIIMIETASALDDLDAILAAAPDALCFVGLNDLHIQLGNAFMFEPLANGVVDGVADAAHRQGTHFGFGGLARLGEGLLDSEIVLREHVRLGSRLVILSRTFFRGAEDDAHVATVRAEIAKIRRAEARAARRSPAQVAEDRLTMQDRIQRVARELNASNTHV